MRTKILSLFLLLTTVNAFAITSYKYQQSIEVSKAGVYKVALSAEVASKAYPNLFNIKLINPKGQIVEAHLNKRDLPVRPSFNSYNSREDERMVVNIALNEPCAAKDITVNFIHDIEAPSSVESSVDGISWAKASESKNIKGKSVKYNVSSKKVRYYRVIINTAVAAEVGDVVVNFIPEKEDNTEVIKVPFEVIDKGNYSVVSVTLPLDNLDLYALRVYTSAANQLKDKQVLASVLRQQDKLFEVIGKFDTSFIDVPNNSRRKDIMVSINSKSANLIHFDIFKTKNLKVTNVELVVLKPELVFNADVKGSYTLFFGSESADVIAKNEALKSKRALGLVSNSRIEGNPAYDDLTAELFPSYKKCGLDPKKAEVMVPLKIKSVGVQSVGVPFKGKQLSKLRILKEGQEIPFIVSGDAVYLANQTIAPGGDSKFRFFNEMKALTSEDVVLLAGNAEPFLVNAEISKKACCEKEDEGKMENVESFVWDFNPRYTVPYKSIPAALKGGVEYLLDLSVCESAKPIMLNDIYYKYTLSTIRFYADDLNGYTLVYSSKAGNAKYKIKGMKERLSTAIAIDAEPAFNLFLNEYEEPAGGLSLYVKWVLSTILIVVVIFMIANYTKKAIRVTKIKKKKATRKRKPRSAKLP